MRAMGESSLNVDVKKVSECNPCSLSAVDNRFIIMCQPCAKVLVVYDQASVYMTLDNQIET